MLPLPRPGAPGAGLGAVEYGHLLVKSALSNVIKKGKKMEKYTSRVVLLVFFVLYDPCFKHELFICFQGRGSLCVTPPGSLVVAVFVASQQVEDRPLAGTTRSHLPFLCAFPS